MKIKKIHIIIWAMMMAHASGVMAMKNMIDTTAISEQEKIEAAITKAKATIAAAQDIIHDIRKKELLGTIKRAQAAQQLREQNAIIADAERTLGRMLKKSVAVVKSAEQEYSLIAQAKKVGSQAVSLAKTGQIVSEKEKRLARRKIKRLREQKEMLLKEYEDEMDVARSNQVRKKLKNRYEKIEAEINEKIDKQQIIAGQAMSPAMKSFWSAVGAGALIATGKYILGGTTGATTIPSVPKEEETPAQTSTPPQPVLPQAPGTIMSLAPVGTPEAPSPMAPTHVQQPPVSFPAMQVPEKKVLTSEEKKMTLKKTIAHFAWTALASAHALFFAVDFAATSPLLAILNPSVGFTGIAAASGAAGLANFIEGMSEKEKAEFLKRPHPFFAR